MQGLGCYHEKQRPSHSWPVFTIQTRHFLNLFWRNLVQTLCALIDKEHSKGHVGLSVRTNEATTLSVKFKVQKYKSINRKEYVWKKKNQLTLQLNCNIFQQQLN